MKLPYSNKSVSINQSITVQLSWAVRLPVQAIVLHSQKFWTTWLPTWPQAWADNTKRD